MIQNRKKPTLILVISITILLIIAYVVINTHDVLRYVLFSSEKIGSYEIAAMRECVSGSEVSTIFKNDDGIEVTFPLPNGAVLFESERYPVRESRKQYLVTTEAFEHYMQEILPQNKFETDQMGAWVHINNQSDNLKVGIDISMFTVDFMRIQVEQLFKTANDTKTPPDAVHFVEDDGDRLLVRGYGDAYLAFSPTGYDMYIAGHMPIIQLEEELIEGSAYFPDDNLNIMEIRVRISRPDAQSGTIVGPEINLTYNTVTDSIEEAEYIPFKNSDGEYFIFELEDENALAFVRIIYEAIQLCIEYGNANDF